MTDERAYRRAFYRAVDQHEGIDRRHDEDYVPIYDDEALGATDVVARILDTIDFSIGESAQLLSGYRGADKTSELLRLKGLLEQSGYAAVYMDVGDFLNPELPPTFDSFLLAIAAGFVQGCEGVPGFEAQARSGWQRFRERLAGLSIQAEVSAKLDVGPVAIGLSLREDPTFRQQVDALIRTNRVTVIRQLHDFFAETASAIGAEQGMVFLVDSIDHFRGQGADYQEVRRAVESIFAEGVDALTPPGIHVVYTIPVFVSAVGFEVRREIVNVKVTEKDGSVFDPGVASLTAVLRRRAPDGDLARLMDDEVLVYLIRQSGGLFRLVGELLLAPHSFPVSRGDIDRAGNQLLGGLSAFLTAEQLAVLQRVRRLKTVQGCADDEMSDVVDLLGRSCILAYPNGSATWHDVHPLLLPSLDQAGGAAGG